MRFDEFIVGEITIERAREVCEKLLSRHASKNISIFLSSEGGDVNGALTMGAAIQAVQRQGRQVHIHVGGCAYSSGVLLLQFADRRTMEPYTSLLIHPHITTPADGSILTISDLTGMADDLSWGEHCYFEVLQRRTGYDIHDLLNKAHYRRQEIILLPQDCLRYNLIDEIMDYALPERGQETAVPSGTNGGNVVLFPPASSRPKTPSKTRRKKA